MGAPVTDPQGRVWRVTAKIVDWPRFPGLGPFEWEPYDGILGLPVRVLLPPVAFVCQLPVTLAAGALRLLAGHWIVAAESERERWTWGAHGRAATARLATDVGEALRAGRDLPSYGRYESRASERPLTERDVARRTPSGHVRVLRPREDAEAR